MRCDKVMKQPIHRLLHTLNIFPAYWLSNWRSRTGARSFEHRFAVCLPAFLRGLSRFPCVKRTEIGKKKKKKQQKKKKKKRKGN